MDWHKLYFGRVSLDEIREAVKDAEWQKLRKEMKGRALAEKYDMLRRYYEETSERLTFDYLKGAYDRFPAGTYGHDMRMLQVRCTNYVAALARGGLIEPKAYRGD